MSLISLPASRSTVRTIEPVMLKTILFGLVGSKMMTIVTKTVVKLAKSHPLFGSVVMKTSHVNICTNFSYANSKRRAAEKQGLSGEFTIHERQWGERLKRKGGKLCPLVSKQKFGREVSFDDIKPIELQFLYLEAKVQKPLGHTYTKDGQSIPNEQVDSFLPPKSEQPGDVIVRDYKLSNIKSITVDGLTYVVA
jgi:hypothetical protein